MRNEYKTIFLTLLILFSFTLSFMLNCEIGEAQTNYPERAVTIICPWAAGGGTDALARFMADQLQKKFGQPFVVINRTGGDGAVGHTAGALAKLMVIQ
jgi:tripartite-type tricarboxylate transporter receptor subunit TctC